MAKNKKDDDLDTETSFADMNVEGFDWYDPNKKKNKEGLHLTRKEFWAAVGGAFRAYWPFLVGLVAIGGVLYGIAWLWLG